MRGWGSVSVLSSRTRTRARAAEPDPEQQNQSRGTSMAEHRDLQMAFRAGTDPQLSLSSLRLLVPPLRLMCACMWRVAQQRNVQQYGKLAEFITLVTEMVPELLTPKQTAELVLGLRARLILELLRREDPLDAEDIQEHLNSIQLLMTDGTQEELPEGEVEASKMAFVELVQTLRDNPSEKYIFFMNVFPEHYGFRFDTTLQVLVWEFLSRLEELLPVSSFFEVASNLNLDSLDPNPNYFVSDPEDFITLLQHRQKGLPKLKKNQHSFRSKIILSSLASRRLSFTAEDIFGEEETAEDGVTGLNNGEQDVADTSLQQTLNNGDNAAQLSGAEEVIGSFQSDTHSSPRAHSLTTEGPSAATRSQSCPYCSQRFTSWSELLGHPCTVHAAVVQGFQCDQCKKQLCSEKALGRHLRAHETGHAAVVQRFQCNQCKRQLCSEKALMRHLKAHQTAKAAVVRAFQCDQCERRLGSAKALKSHLRTHSRSQSVVCPQCNKVLKSASWLKTHLRLHTGERPFPCTFCGKRFKEKGVLKAHLKVHGAEYSYLCSECGKGFNHMTSLIQHNRMHSGERPYPCSVCDMKFASSQRLHEHQRIHTGERPHPCTYCEKRFRTGNHLTRHIRTHTGEKPYQCLVCDKRFSLRSNMKIHMRVHDKEHKNS